MTDYLLALETSSSVCGVALLVRERDCIHIRAMAHDATAEHAERLLPMVDELLVQTGIDASCLRGVAFGQGPGGFTGLRVACGVAQGIAFGLGLPVFPVDSLLAVAARDFQQSGDASVDELRVVLQDARMNEVYLGVYALTSNGWTTVQAPVLIAADAVAPWVESVRANWRSASRLYCLGDALQAYPALAQDLSHMPHCRLGPGLRADAPSVARLAFERYRRAEGIAPDLAAPLYVRDKVAFTTLEREQGAGGNPRAVVPVVLLPMAYEHLEQVAEIEQRVQSFPWTLKNFSDGLQAGYGAWVVCEGSVVLGFCMVMFAPDVAHLLVIAVHPDAQRRGLATRLMDHCEQQARERGLPGVILEVRPSNLGALAFYAARGYTRLSMRKNYYPAAHGGREDACIMQKDVS